MDIKGNQLDLLDNQIDTVTRGFQALTVSCARCHDHKFDAISTKDFYALYGVLASSRYAQADVGEAGKFVGELKKLVMQREELVRTPDGRSRREEAQISQPETRNPKPETFQSLLTSAATKDWFFSGAALHDARVQPGDPSYAPPHL